MRISAYEAVKIQVLKDDIKANAEYILGILAQDQELKDKAMETWWPKLTEALETGEYTIQDSVKEAPGTMRGLFIIEGS